MSGRGSNPCPTACVSDALACLKTFIEFFSQFKNKQNILCGDFNIDLLDDNIHTNNFLNTFQLNNLFQSINNYKLQSAYDDIFLWSKLNKLSLNIDKTHCMSFKNYIIFNINIDNKPTLLSQVTSTKFLGINLDTC